MATLYILGNGFDLAHKLPTRYECFRSFLRDNRDRTLLPGNDNTHGTFGEVLDDLEKYYPDIIRGKGVTEWNNFEAALANPNPEFAHDMNALAFSGYFKKRLTLAFSAWAASIDPRDSIIRLNIDRNAAYINFNYTMTLENLYGVPKNNVLHIHGSAEMYAISTLLRDLEWDDTEVIFGHGKRDIANNPLAAQFYKNTEVIFERKKKRLETIFKRCGGIDKIKCFGHSFEEVDKLYFRRLVTLFPTAKWYLGYHSPNDKHSRNDFAREAGIINYEVIPNLQVIVEEK